MTRSTRFTHTIYKIYTLSLISLQPALQPLRNLLDPEQIEVHLGERRLNPHLFRKALLASAESPARPSCGTRNSCAAQTGSDYGKVSTQREHSKKNVRGGDSNKNLQKIDALREAAATVTNDSSSDKFLREEIHWVHLALSQISSQLLYNVARRVERVNDNLKPALSAIFVRRKQRSHLSTRLSKTSVFPIPCTADYGNLRCENGFRKNLALICAGSAPTSKAENISPVPEIQIKYARPN